MIRYSPWYFPYMAAPYILGYENLLIDINKFAISRARHPVWGKLHSIMEAFAKYPSTEWVWWLVDAIIMTPICTSTY